MSGTDLRKFMNLMESITVTVADSSETAEESVIEDESVVAEASGITGMDLDAVLWQLFEYGRDAEAIKSSDAENRAKTLVSQIVAKYGSTVESIAEETLEETGNANAQMKGINFSGTPAKKNSGDMSLSSPKSKAAGSKTPLAQAKSGTNVGQKKS